MSRTRGRTADPATRKIKALASALAAGSGTAPRRQGSDHGDELLLRCPLCEAEGRDTKGRMLRIAQRLDGSDLPFVGCRRHDEPGDWNRLRAALIERGAPEELLVPATRDRPRGRDDPKGAGRPGAGRPAGGFPARPDGLGESDPVDDEQIDEWTMRLFGPSGRRYLDYLRRRGLTDETIRTYRLGLGAFRWGVDKKPQPKITIPIFNADGICVNVRLGSIKPGVKRLPLPHPELTTEDGERYLTYGAPTRLYGVDSLAASAPDEVVLVVAGEYDRLLAEQAGFPAVSGTGGEGALPRAADGAHFAGRDVVIVFDADAAGRKGAAKWAAALHATGAAVRVVELDADRDDGYDLADLLAEHGAEAGARRLHELIRAAPGWTPAADTRARRESGAAPAWEFSDQGIADQVAHRVGAHLRYIPESSSWMRWSTRRGVWVVGSARDAAPATNAVLDYVREIAEDLAGAEEDGPEDAWRKFVAGYANAGRNTGAVRMLSAMPSMRVPLASLDARGDLLGVANGVLDLSSGELYDARPEDLMTKQCRGAILENLSEGEVESEGEKIWRDFIERSVPDPGTRNALQTMAGISLLDGNPLQVMVFTVGKTGTGKSAFSELMKHALGTYGAPLNLSTFRDNQDERPRADLVRLLTQRVAFASEASAAWHLHVDQIKRLTGEDSIQARLPHSPEYVERMPAFTPWLRTNNPPTIHQADQALWRRMVVFPFNEPYRGTDKARAGGGYVARVRDIVADAVITWAVEGLLRWLDSGGGDLEKSPEMMLAEMSFREELNDVQAFLAAMTKPGSARENRVPARDLYEAYAEWCFASGVPSRDVLGVRAFGLQMSSLGYEKYRSAGVVYRLGIRLTSASDR